MFERGVAVAHESIRRWRHKVGPPIAAALLQRPPQPKDNWHLDEMHIKMQGRTY